MPPKATSSISILDEIEGTTIRVPELGHIFEKWPHGINPNHEQSRAFLDTIYDDLFSNDERALSRARSYNIHLCGARWWPNANLRELCICTWLLAFLFLWDDQFDSNSGSFFDESEDSNQTIQEAISWVSQCLHIPSLSEPIVPSNSITHTFRIIGDALCQSYTPEQRETYFQEFLFYVDSMRQEQRLKDSGIIPSLEDYIRLRIGSSAVGQVYGLSEFSMNRRIPELLKNTSAMKVIREQVALIIALVNDIASFKKELKSDCLHNFIPVAYHAGRPLQDAVLETVDRIENCVKTFDKASEELLGDAKAYGYTADDIQWFIELSQYYCTGNFDYSMVSTRYDIQGAYEQSTNGDIYLTL